MKIKFFDKALVTFVGFIFLALCIGLISGIIKIIESSWGDSGLRILFISPFVLFVSYMAGLILVKEI